MKYKNIKKIGLSIICFEGTEHLYNIISPLRDIIDYVSVGLQRESYHGARMSNVDINEIYRLKNEDHLIDEIIDIKLDTNVAARIQETDKRNILIQDAEDHGCSHVLVIDSDEYYTRKSFEYGIRQIDDNDYEMTYCQYINYYGDYKHVLKYPFDEGMYVPFITKVKYRYNFECTDFQKPSDPTRRYVRPFDRIDKVKDNDGNIHEVKHYTVDYHIFDWNEVKMHHLSWIRSDIRKKLENWSSKKVFNNYEDLIDKSVNSFENFKNDNSQKKAVMLFNTPGNCVDITELPKQYIHPREDINKRLRPAKDYKKILFLSMSADIDIFNQLEKVSNETWRNVDNELYKNINAEFWTYTDAKDGDETSVDMKNHIIYIKKDEFHKENLINSTYSKTLEAFKIINEKLNLEYDYIVRTNNSTWINIPLVNEFFAYIHDDSKIYAARLFSAFWSAFNVYAGGQFIAMSKRSVNIFINTCGSVDEAKEFEKKVTTCDDNIIGGKMNARYIQLGIPYIKIYHTIGIEMLYKKDITEYMNDLDFTCPVYQIKTYDIPLSERINYDINKMMAVDSAWRKRSAEVGNDIDELYNEMMKKYYDKTIFINKLTKSEWLNNDNMMKRDHDAILSDDNIHERVEGFRFLESYQKKCGYQSGIFL